MPSPIVLSRPAAQPLVGFVLDPAGLELVYLPG
jgi:hypothetical protein